MAINPNTNFTGGQVLTSDNANRWPRGVMAYATRGTNFAPTTTIADLGISVTFTAVASRYYRYTFICYAADSSTAVNLQLIIADTANNVKGESYTRVAGPALYSYVTCVYVTTETAGSVTRKVRAGVNTGNATMLSGLNGLALLVEDIGPA